MLLINILSSCKKTFSSIYFETLFAILFMPAFISISYGKPGRPPRFAKCERMNLKDTYVSYHKLPKQAITCQLAEIEMDTWTANAKFSFSEVASKKKKQEEEVCLTIPPWSKIQAPQIGSPPPQHWFKTPTCCDVPLTNMGLSILKIKTVEKQRRNDVISSRQQTTY